MTSTHLVNTIHVFNSMVSSVDTDGFHFSGGGLCSYSVGDNKTENVRWDIEENENSDPLLILYYSDAYKPFWFSS